MFWRILSKLACLQFWCVYSVANRLYYRDSYLKFHSRVYHRPMPRYTVAYYVAYSLEWIDSMRLSSTLHALPTPPPQRPSKFNRSASISGTPAKVGWTCPPGGDAHECISQFLLSVSIPTCCMIELFGISGIGFLCAGCPSRHPVNSISN